MGRRRLGLILALAVVVIAVLWWQLAGRAEGGPQYRTAAVQRGDVKLQVSATGTLSPVTTVQVGSQVSGTIASLYVDFNDAVREGQVLAQLDPTFLRAQVAQSVADLNRAQTEVRQALRDSVRIFPLGAEGLASKADLDAAQTAVDAARASEASAQAALERAQTNLQYATITSPINGVVISRDVDVGQTVAASLSAPTLYTIAQDLAEMQLEAAVDEADIGSVREGQPATFTVDAYPERNFSGRVHQIRLSPETVQNVVTYTVIIRVENPEQRLLPGMTANVTILVDEAKDVLKVPAAAFRFRPPSDGRSRSPEEQGSAPGTRTRGPDSPPEGRSAKDGNQKSLYVLNGEGTLRPVPVSVGISDGTFTAVRSDSLQEGMTVVVGLDAGGGRTQQPETVNPFAPRMPAGRGGQRRG